MAKEDYALLAERFIPSVKSSSYVSLHWMPLDEELLSVGIPIEAFGIDEDCKVRWIQRRGGIMEPAFGSRRVLSVPSPIASGRGERSIIIVGRRSDPFEGCEFDAIVVDPGGSKMLHKLSYVFGRDADLVLDGLSIGEWSTRSDTTVLPPDVASRIHDIALNANDFRTKSVALVDTTYQMLQSDPSLLFRVWPEMAGHTNPIGALAYHRPGDLIYTMVEMIEQVLSYAIIQLAVERELEELGPCPPEERRRVSEKHRQGSVVVNGLVVERAAEIILDIHGIPWVAQTKAKLDSLENKVDLLIPNLVDLLVAVACKTCLRGDRASAERCRHILAILKGYKLNPADIPSSEIRGHAEANLSRLVVPERFMDDGGPLSHVQDGSVISLHQMIHGTLGHLISRDMGEIVGPLGPVPAPTRWDPIRRGVKRGRRGNLSYDVGDTYADQPCPMNPIVVL